MKRTLFLMLLSVAPYSFAQPTATPVPASKSQYSNVQVYEKEDHQSKFSDVVKVIREMDGGTEIVFSKFGTYYAPTDGSAMERLVESQKSKLPVNVVFNEDSRKLLKVSAPQKPTEKAGAGPNK